MDELDLGATIRGFGAGQKVFSRYTLKNILGRGGMGVVWQARDETLEQDVAIKMLPEIVARDPVAIRELKRETRRCQGLAHPHILKVHDFVEGGGLCGISMELVEGGTLSARRLEQPGETFTPQQLAPWLDQLLDALQYAHQKAQVVHRDLKPVNLMLTAGGDLKIADFGISASVSDSVSRVSAQAGSSGTPVYMSPQQMMGEKPVITDDIYAIGATLYELLTGKPPFYSGNVLLQVQGKVPPSIAERRREFGCEDAVPFVNAAWETTISACLAKEAKDRPQSAAEVAERLGLAAKDRVQRAVSNGERPKPETAGSGGSPRPALIGRSEAKNSKAKLPVMAGIVAAVLVLSGTGYYFGLYAPEQARQEQARREAAARQEQARLDLAAKARAEEIRLASARGGLVLHITPATAEVQIGGFALEHGPVVTLKEVRLGKYPVVATAPDFEAWHGEVVVGENQFANLEVTLTRSTGAVELSSTPAGAAFVLQQTGRESAKRTGVTPAKVDGLPTGTYTVEFSAKGLKRQTAAGEVSRGKALHLEAVLPPAKRDDFNFVTDEVMALAQRVTDAEARDLALNFLGSALERANTIERVEIQPVVAAQIQAAKEIPDQYARAVGLRNTVARASRFDPVLARAALEEAAVTARKIEDHSKRVYAGRWLVEEGRFFPDLAVKLLEEYRALLGPDRTSYENRNLPEEYARLGLTSQARSLVNQYAEGSDRKMAEEALAQGEAFRIYDQAMALLQKGDRAGARTVLSTLPAEIPSTPCIYMVYGFVGLGEFDLGQLAADHVKSEYRKKNTNDWLASASLVYDRPDLAVGFARANEDATQRESSWRSIAQYFALHGLLREARSAAAEISGAGTSYQNLKIWTKLNDREKARQAAALLPELAGTKDIKGHFNLAEELVILGDTAKFAQLENGIAIENAQNRSTFYRMAASGYCELGRWDEALGMIGKIPLAKDHVWAGYLLGQRAGALMSSEAFSDWVDRLPEGGLKASVLAGWILAMVEKHNLTRLGYAVPL